MNQETIWNFFQNDPYLDAFKESWPRYAFLAKRVAPSKKILNIGVGKGGLEGILISNGVDVSCLDPNIESIAQIRSQYDLGNKAQVGYSQNMPFDNEIFDMVVMSEVIEHLDERTLTDTLREVLRVLKPGGFFIGTVPANEVLTDNIAMCPNCNNIFHRWGHIQSFSKSSLKHLLMTHGFDRCQVETRAFPNWRRGGLINLTKSSLRYVMGRFGFTIAHPSIFFSARRDYQGSMKCEDTPHEVSE